jgi:RimJ/RimL family protein N-acetyltransferase
MSEATTTSDPVDDSAGQTFLIGDDIFLRGPRIDDAKRSAALRPSPFPVATERAEKELREALPKALDKRILPLVVCRRGDGEPVGSTALDLGEDWPSALFRVHAAPWLAASAQDELVANVLRLVVPWLSEERGTVSVAADLDGGMRATLAAAAEVGMREAYRLRGGFWRDGARRDWTCWQKLHPAWVERMGDPGPGILVAGEPVVDPKGPTPLRWPESPFPLPPNTFIASPRLALRPFEVADAPAVADSFRREPDPFRLGRYPLSPVVLSTWWEEQGEHEPQADVELAVVLRETGQVIGDIGVYRTDWVGRTAETGIWLYRPEHRGGGLGTEAKHLLLEYAFDRLDLHLLWSWVDATNLRSAAAVRKQGYRDAGRYDWVGLGPAGFRSALLFDLLASEWRAARR